MGEEPGVAVSTDPNAFESASQMTPPPLPDVGNGAARKSGMLCPYCGNYSGSKKECDRCKGVFEPLSRQASQNGMGPWFIRDEGNPFRPGCSYATMRMLVSRKRIVAESVLRGPSTRQFWTFAKNTPGIAHLLGECHACHKSAIAEAAHCPHCNASFTVEEDRQYLGLAEVRVIPGQVMPETPRASSRSAAVTAPSQPLSEQARSRAVFASDTHAIPMDGSAEESGDAPAATAYEPIRNPARPMRASASMSDGQIDDLLRRSGSSDRVKRSTTIVVVLVMAALVAVVLMIVLAVVIYAGAAKNAANPSGNATTGAAPATPAPAPSVPASPAKAPGK